MSAGIASAHLRVQRPPRRVSDPAVLDAIAKADGIFIAGGDQATTCASERHAAGAGAGCARPRRKAARRHQRRARDPRRVVVRRAGRRQHGLRGRLCAIRSTRHDPGRGFPAHALPRTRLHRHPLLKRERLGRLVAFVADARARARPASSAGRGRRRGPVRGRRRHRAPVHADPRWRRLAGGARPRRHRCWKPASRCRSPAWTSPASASTAASTCARCRSTRPRSGASPRRDGQLRLRDAAPASAGR